MESNKRLYVFDKKEILLVFILVLLISTTCFVYGVKIGKTYSLGVQGIIDKDIERVELLSQKEEQVLNDEEKLEEIVKKASIDKKVESVVEPSVSYDRLKEKIDTEVLGAEESVQEIREDQEKKKVIEQNKPIPQTNPGAVDNQKSISGKWTIQLGSHQNKEDADAFADGFRVRGYDPIINQVYLGERGVWFRVSLGLFSSIVEAKNYVIEHQTLFDGQDYVFIQFD